MILYLFVYYLRDIFWRKTLCAMKKLQLIFWNKRKVSKQRVRTFGSTCMSTNFVPNTKVGDHLLVLQNLLDVLKTPIAIEEGLYCFSLLSTTTNPT